MLNLQTCIVTLIVLYCLITLHRAEAGPFSWLFGSNDAGQHNESEQSQSTGPEAHQVIRDKAPGKLFDRKSESLVPEGPILPSIVYDKLYPTTQDLFPFSDSVPDLSHEEVTREIKILQETGTKSRRLLDNIYESAQRILGGELHEYGRLMSLLSDFQPQKIAVVGTQGVGKSHVLNVICGIGLALSDVKLGTRAVVYYKMRFAPEESKYFAVDGVPVNFEQISVTIRERFQALGGSEVVDGTVTVEVHAPFVSSPLDLVDVPGYAIKEQLTDRRNAVVSIIKRLAQDPDVTFLNILDAQRDPESEADAVVSLLQQEVGKDRIIYVLNRVHSFMKDNHSHDEVAVRLEEVMRFIDPEFRVQPYIFAMGKLPDNDKLALTSVTEQINRWKTLAEQGENHALEFAQTINPYWQRRFGADYPSHLLGVSNWRRRMTDQLINNSRRKLQSFIKGIRSEVHENTQKDLGKVAWIAEVQNFASKFLQMIEQVMTGGEAIHNAVKQYGGAPFQEVDEIQTKRTKQCTDELILSGKLKPRSEGRRIYRDLGDVLTVMPSNEPESGQILMERQMSSARLLMLSAYVDLSHDDMYPLAMKADPRHSDICQHQIVPEAVSRIGKSIFSDVMAQSVAAGLRCTYTRQARAALWMMLQNEDATSALRLLADQTKFRDFVNNGFQEFMHEIFDRTTNYIKVTLGASIDAIIEPGVLDQRKHEIKAVFPDLIEHWHKIESDVRLCFNRKIRVGDKNMEAQKQRVLDASLLEAKMHYSERVIRGANAVHSYLSREWLELSKLSGLEELGNNLKPLVTTEEAIIRLFGLADVVEGATALEKAQNEHDRIVAEGCGRLTGVLEPAFDKLQGSFDLFGPRVTTHSSTHPTRSVHEHPPKPIHNQSTEQTDKKSEVPSNEGAKYVVPQSKTEL